MDEMLKDPHLKKAKRYKSQVRASLAYMERHLKAGLCVLCPSKAVNKNHCERHRLDHNERNRKRPKT